MRNSSKLLLPGATITPRLLCLDQESQSYLSQLGLPSHFHTTLCDAPEPTRDVLLLSSHIAPKRLLPQGLCILSAGLLTFPKTHTLPISCSDRSQLLLHLRLVGKLMTLKVFLKQTAFSDGPFSHNPSRKIVLFAPAELRSQMFHMVPSGWQISFCLEDCDAAPCIMVHHSCLNAYYSQLNIPEIPVVVVQPHQKEQTLGQNDQALLATALLYGAEALVHDAVSCALVLNFMSIIEQCQQHLHHINKNNAYLADHDALTGVYNLGSLQRNHAQWLSSGCSILMIDIDHFKTINDTYGHIVGNRVLQQFARLLQKIGGNAAKIFRIGGEEFLIIVNNSCSLKGLSLAETLRASIEQHSFQSEGQTIKMSASVGVYALGIYNGQNKDLNETLKKLDDALYSAKCQRNCVYLAA